jgi:hypothetical protein
MAMGECPQDAEHVRSASCGHFGEHDPWPRIASRRMTALKNKLIFNSQ